MTAINEYNTAEMFQNSLFRGGAHFFHNVTILYLYILLGFEFEDFKFPLQM